MNRSLVGKKFYKGGLVGIPGADGVTWYHYRYRDENGVRRTISLKTDKEEEAKELKETLNLHRRLTGKLPAEVNYPTWDKAVAEYLKHCRENKKKDGTLVKTEIALNWFKDIVKPVRPQDVSKRDAQLFVDAMLGKMAASSVVSYLKYVRPFFRKLHEWGRTTQNPFTDIGTPKKDAKESVWFEDKVLDQILENVRLHEEPIAYLAAMFFQDTGERLGEGHHQRLEDVDFIGGFLKVAFHKPGCACYPCDKTGRKGWKPKGDKERFIPLTPRLLKCLTDIKKERGKGTLFHCHENTIQNWMKRAYKRLGILNVGDRAAVHVFRHSLISQMDRAGVRKTEIEAIVGHGKQDITGHYTHSAKAEMKLEFQKLIAYRERVAAEAGERKFQII